MQKIAIIFEEDENQLPSNKFCYINSMDLDKQTDFETAYVNHVTSLAEAMNFCKVSDIGRVDDTKYHHAWIFFVIGDKTQPKGFRWKLMAETGKYN